MRFLRAIFFLFRDAGLAWGQDKASLYAAAIAYYMVFSVAPLLVFSIAIAGRVFGQVAVEGQLVAQVEKFVGPEAAILLESLLQNAISGSSSFTLISVAVLLWAASGVFNHLKRALDMIFRVIPKPMPGIKGALHVVRTRFLTFAMVLLMGALLLASLALNAVAATLGSYLTTYLPDLAVINTYVIRFIAPFLMLMLFSTLFKALPEVRIAWRDVLLGAVVTTLLFLLGIYVIGIYLGMTNVGSVYGAAGSLIVVLVWIYYSTQILMFGAEFTKVYANRYGRPIVPRRNATSLAEHYTNTSPYKPPEPKHEPEVQERVYFGTPVQEAVDAPAGQGQKRKQIGAGLLGLAIGLFLGFIGQFLQDE